MKHRAPPRRVHVPVVGDVSATVLARIGGGVGAGLLLVLLSLVPLLLAHHDASSAEKELNQANADLAAQRIGAAQASLARARGQVAGAQGHLHGPMADLWSHLPILGPAVDDGRHLVSALGEATSAATIGVDIIAHATSPGSRLIAGNRVDLQEIHQLATRARAIGPHLRAAQAQIAMVRGDDPLVGGKIAALKQHASQQLSVTRTSYRHFQPLLRSLPGVLGADGRRTYLVTIMNPAEQRFSGGATLQMATVSFDHGVITFGRSRSVADVDQKQPFLTWPPVAGNLFHTPGPRRLASATYSPWWRVSGEELLRAWHAQTGQRCQGLIAVDLQAIAALFAITGPMEVSGYGELNAQNVVETLAGSYGKFSNPFLRRRLNNALVPVFQQKLLSGGSFVEKGRSLVQDAKSRHAAFYFRDPATQDAFTVAGFAGNLSTTRHDYLGIFSQNLNGSKADYWQVRHVNSHVTLKADGSAYDSLSLSVQNASPGRASSTPDPRTGYTTRWLGTAVGVFLPTGAQLGAVAADGSPVAASLAQTHTGVRGVVNRPFLRHHWMLAPDTSAQLTANYGVPQAARVDRRTGDLVYELAMDPQDLVVPQSNRTTLTIPTGYSFGQLPAGWTKLNDTTAQLWVPQLDQSMSWRIPVYKR